MTTATITYTNGRTLPERMPPRRAPAWVTFDYAQHGRILEPKRAEDELDDPQEVALRTSIRDIWD